MLVDSHCHLLSRKYDKPVKDIITDAAAYGVNKMICVGTSLRENARVTRAVQDYAELYGSVGIYAHDDMRVDIKLLLQKLEQQLKSHEKIVAVGECGIDITEWHGGRDLAAQLVLFEEQLKLAVKMQLPVVVHNRNGEEPVHKLIKKYAPQGLTGVIHCFGSNWEFAQKVMDLGFYISFAGNITYPSNKNLREIVARMPINRFLVETDSPYLPPQGYRGQVNEPKYVRIVAEKVADIRNISLEETCEHAYNNTCALFKIV